MAAIVKELTIVATPQNVFNALTQQDEIARWWPDDLSVKPEVDTLAELRFTEGTFVIQFQVVEKERNTDVSHSRGTYYRSHPATRLECPDAAG